MNSPSPPEQADKSAGRSGCIHRLLAAAVVVQLGLAGGITGWGLWQGRQEEGKRPDIATNGIAADGFSATSPAPDSAGGPAVGTADDILSDPPEVAGSERPPEGSQEGSDPVEPALRTGLAMEELAGRRAMQEGAGGPRDLRENALKAGQVLNSVLGAASVDETLSHVRHGDAMRPLLEDFAQRSGERRLPERVTVRRASLVNLEGLPVLLLQLNDQRFRAASFVEDMKSGEWLLDWESFVGFSELSWEELRRNKPTTPVSVRSYALLEDYYNFEFADPEEYLSLRLDSPDNFHGIYAYVPRDSPFADQILRDLASRRPRPALMLIRYPESAVQDNQVIVEEVIAWRWMDVRDAPTGHFIGSHRQIDETIDAGVPDSGDDQPPAEAGGQAASFP